MEKKLWQGEDEADCHIVSTVRTDRWMLVLNLFSTRISSGTKTYFMTYIHFYLSFDNFLHVYNTF